MFAGREHYGLGSISFTYRLLGAITIFIGPLQLVCGRLGGVVFFKRTGSLMVAVLLNFALWLYSVGLTHGGLFYSLRVLSPAVVLLSVTAGPLIAQLMTSKSKRQKNVVTVLLIGVFLMGAVQSLTVPMAPWKVSSWRWLPLAFSPSRPSSGGGDFRLHWNRPKRKDSK